MAKTGNIRAMLSEGEGRMAAGRAAEVAALILASPAKGSWLIECLWDKDPGVANRAAQALEQVTREGLAHLDRRLTAIVDSWKNSLLGLLGEATERKLRWHLALIVPRLSLTGPECRRAAETLESWLEDRSSIIGTCALQGLYDLTRRDPSLSAHVLDLLRIHSRTGTPAMRARGRLLLRDLESS